MSSLGRFSDRGTCFCLSFTTAWSTPTCLSSLAAPCPQRLSSLGRLGDRGICSSPRRRICSLENHMHPNHVTRSTLTDNSRPPSLVSPFSVVIPRAHGAGDLLFEPARRHNRIAARQCREHARTIPEQVIRRRRRELKWRYQTPLLSRSSVTHVLVRPFPSS